ncbi:MAG: UDP-N-acetylmuramoyl-L-alanine--D-glutamate ligase [Erythrobacter sp.]
MITSSAFAGKKYAVLGLARSGAAATETLLASGAQVTAWDRQDVAREAFVGRCELADPLEIDLTGFDGLVVSPGVPLNTHPIADHAAKFGVPVIGDIELFAQARGDLPRHKVVGVTGTNGKSTTVALIHHILQSAGIASRLGGNIGVPILGEEPLPEGGVYVLELSSYQIDLTQGLDCDVAVLLNITPDHLDRYDGFEAYAASKGRLFAMQSVNSISIAGHRDTARFELNQLAEINQFIENVFHPNTIAADEQINWPSLQGPHNAQNAAAAIEVCVSLGLSVERVRDGLETFKGLPHRMERTATHDGVLYINDSKATNQASTAPALSAFPPDPAINGGAKRVHWIVGGLPKEDGLGECEEHLHNVAAAYTIGEAGPRFAELLEGRVPVNRAELLSDAVAQAKANAGEGEVILFSPACASFDQFRDFEKRGEHFRQVVAALNSAEISQTGEAA